MKTQHSVCKIWSKVVTKILQDLGWLLTGHDSVNRHLTLLKTEEDPMCRLCGEEYDSSLHHLGRCSAFVGKLRKWFGKHLL